MQSVYSPTNQYFIHHKMISQRSRSGNWKIGLMPALTLIRHFVPASPHWEAQGLCNFLSGQLKFLWEAQKNALPLGEGLLKAYLIRIS